MSVPSSILRIVKKKFDMPSHTLKKKRRIKESVYEVPQS